jgi:hypothetical protein
MSSKPLSIGLDLDVEALRLFADDRAGAIRRGAMRGAARFRARAKLEIRQDTRRALGDRAANTWRDDLYPKGRAQSWRPAVVVWSKWPTVINVFTEGATIRAKNVAMLAIPTDAVPYKDRRRMTPEEVEARFDQDLIVRPGKNGNLLAFIDKGLRGRLKRWRKKGAAGDAPTARRDRLVLMFILVRQVTLRPRVNYPAIADRLAPVFREYLAAEIANETAR